jgi:hypothetical protein
MNMYVKALLAHIWIYLFRDHMRKILKLPTFISIEYKKHEDSMVDKSSFR